MRADQLELLFGQLARLAENVVHDHELAEVVQHAGPAHHDDVGRRDTHHHRELARVEGDAGRVALEVRILRLQGDDEGRNRVDQIFFEVLAQEQLLQGDRRRLRIAEEERLLVGQEGAHGIAHARDHGGESLEAMLAFGEHHRFPAAGLDHVAERRLQERQDLADHRRLALPARVELAALVAEQHQRPVAPEALHRVLDHFLGERARLETLQGDLADPRDDLDTALASGELFREPRGIVDVAVALRPVTPEPTNELLHLGHREGLGQIVVRAVAQAEDRRVDRRHAGDEHDRRPGLLALDRAEQVEAAQAWHLDVRHHEVERIVAKLLERLLGRPRRRHLASIRRERGGQESEDGGVVVHQENAKPLSRHAAGNLSLAGHRGRHGDSCYFVAPS